MAKAKTGRTVHVFDFLGGESLPGTGICALFGGERFLKKLALKKIVEATSGGDPDFQASEFDGESVKLADVMDELSTRTLFGGDGPKVVVVDHADSFVTNFRSQLEDLSEKEVPGLLILFVGKWASNTRLYKRIDKGGMQIRCDAPLKGKSKTAIDTKAVGQWLVNRAKVEHQFSLPAGGAQLLIDLTDGEFGRMDQELQKLALYVDAKGKVDNDTGAKVVGGWKTQTMWEAIEAACSGDAGTALTLLDHLLHSGEHPLALFGSMAWSLRRYGVATEIVFRQARNGRRPELHRAVQEAGFRPWGGEIETSQEHLKQLGSQRTSKILDWLTEADLALKRSHSQEGRSRLVLEKLFVRMAKELGPQAA